MSTRRARDFNGMLRILRDTHRGLADATQLLGRSMDTESEIGRAQVQQLRDEIEHLGRDLANGLVDLEEAPLLDRFSWHRLFILKSPKLESDSRDCPTRPMRVPWARKRLRRS